MRMDASTKDMSVTLLLDPASALDVAAMVVDGIDLSPGTAIPSDGDPRIDHALKGFLFTCGPDHIRHPEPIEPDTSVGNSGLYPLHGSLCGTPVADLLAEDDGCVATVEVHLADGGRARLTRRWTIRAERVAVHLEDRIENIGASPFAPLWMYHLNIAGHLFDDATVMTGAMIADGGQGWMFGEGASAHVCLPADGGDRWAHLRVGPFAALSGRSLDVRFRTDSLPFLQMWRCQRGEANVVSIEPVSHRIAKRPDLAANGELPSLAPGESRSYALSFGIVPSV
jgi:hypothetical protein